MFRLLQFLTIFGFMVALSFTAIVSQGTLLDAVASPTPSATPLAGTDENPTATPTAASAARNNDTQTAWLPFSDPGFKLLMVVAVAVTIGFLVVQIRRIVEAMQLKQEGLIKLYMASGVIPNVSMSGSLFTAARSDLIESESQPAPITATITGPAMIKTGEIATYILALDGDAPNDISWSLEPAQDGLVQGNDSGASVISQKAGVLKLVVTITSAGQKESAAFTISVVEPPKRDAITLPNLTAGWGTLIVTIVILGFGLIIVLVTGEVAAVVAIFGTIAGYAFGRDKTISP